MIKIYFHESKKAISLYGSDGCICHEQQNICKFFENIFKINESWRQKNKDNESVDGDKQDEIHNMDEKHVLSEGLIG